MNTDWLFIHERLPDSFRDLFFGPILPEEAFVTFGDQADMGNLIAQTGIFPSASQARKNGWNRPVPEGFSRFIHKKTRREGFILNLFPGWETDF